MLVHNAYIRGIGVIGGIAYIAVCTRNRNEVNEWCWKGSLYTLVAYVGGIANVGF